MNMSLPASPSRVPSQTLPARAGWAIADAWAIARRDLVHWQMQPGVVLMGWFFPVMITLMFGLLYGGAIRIPEGSSYYEFLMPGMFAMTMLFGLETTMLAITTDAARGVTDRFRSMPVSDLAVVLGRCIADMLNAAVGLAVMTGTGLLLGWRWHAGLGSALGSLGLLLLLRFALVWVGIYMGLTAKSPESVASVQILVWPVSFLSNVFVDPITMPAWLGAIAQWNPLSAVASAARELFANPGWTGGAWVTENSLLLALLWPLAITAVFLPLSVRKWRRLRE